ncbi:hypothetical protein CBR_g12703 [Chara braunii]|uniref:Uncharacterized protein n=1 Tax=Chara braunii TaxID=69332 RepID=A0A388KSD3_CHABU|nr:hypothetical protein CBR_g12703 [Chara braunii]|eukprot:GBG72985.1 hypothetical protein CBR_g12703 [Chara braunii]
MSAPYDRVNMSKLKLKGGEDVGDGKQLKKKKKRKKKGEGASKAEEGGEVEGGNGGVQLEEDAPYDIGTGHAPDGKKSKKYEELFPAEAARFKYQLPEGSREAALDERVKKKADRYCK